MTSLVAACIWGMRRTLAEFWCPTSPQCLCKVPSLNLPCVIACYKGIVEVVGHTIQDCKKLHWGFILNCANRPLGPRSCRKHVELIAQASWSLGFSCPSSIIAKHK